MNVHNKIVGKERVYDNSISNNSIFYGYYNMGEKHRYTQINLPF